MGIFKVKNIGDFTVRLQTLQDGIYPTNVYKVTVDLNNERVYHCTVNGPEINSFDDHCKETEEMAINEFTITVARYSNTITEYEFKNYGTIDQLINLIKSRNN